MIKILTSPGDNADFLETDDGTWSTVRLKSVFLASFSATCLAVHHSDWSIHPLNTKVVEEGLKKSVDLAVILIFVLQRNEILDIPESVFIQRWLLKKFNVMENWGSQIFVNFLKRY